MKKVTHPFQLVIHWDENGDVRATANYRTVYYDDDGKEITRKIGDSVTLDEASKDFPWKKFLGKAQEDALRQAEKIPLLQAQVSEAQAQTKEREAQIEVHKQKLSERDNIIRDRDQLLMNVLVNMDSLSKALANDIAARQPKAEKA